MKKVVIHTDGGARGNPGPSGLGYTIDIDGKVHEGSRFLGVQTNNFAEYEAIAEALSHLKRLVGEKGGKEIEVEVKMDSELAQRQLTGKYRITEPTLFPQFIKVWNMKVAYFPNITYTHIRRELNKDADRLSNEAMDRGR